MATNLLSSFIGFLTLLGLVPPVEPSVSSQSQSGDTPAPVLVRPEKKLFDAAAASKPLPTIGTVDVQRYSGLWYELARLPVRFQDPTSVSTARYTEREDGLIGVENTAFIGANESYALTGTAEPVDPARADKLRVRFGGFLRAIPVADEGNYWIIDIDKDYTLALVGTPDRSFLWLLARDPKTVDLGKAQALLNRAATLGFDTSKLSIADWENRVIRE